MTDNKAVMQQALDVLRNHSGNYKLNRKECLAQEAVEDALIAAIAQPVQPSLAERIQREINHCVMNDLRLAPFFGRLQGELAVRVSTLEVILETSAQPTQPESTK